jgi:porin
MNLKGALLRCCFGLLLAVPGAVRGTPPAQAGPTEAQPETNEPGQSAANQPPTTFWTELSRSDKMLGDMAGLRPFLNKYGITLTIQETSELLGNVSGGVREGFEYDGLTQAVLQLDTEKAFGLHGGTFNISGLQIHGRNLSAENLDTLQTASGIEGDRSTRLWELWYQQTFLKDDALDVKIGQQSLDQEFMVSQNALLFVNTMFGWPMLPSADLPGGGPAYPLSALGVRVRWRPTDSLTLLAGVFNGTPVSDTNGDPQMANASGLSFPLHSGVLAIGELQYAYPALGSMVYSSQSRPLSGVYKLGFWYDTENFADEETDDTGLSLANPESNGNPRTHYGDYAIYAVVDQMVWSDADDEDADRTVNFFARGMGAPEEDRNLIDISANAGFTFHEPIPHRDDDTLGIGMGYAKVSDSAADSDKDTAFFTGSYYPIRGSEEFVELTYQYQVTPWCQMQPDFQYVFDPGAGILNPNSGHRVKGEAVLGVRMNVQF